MSWATCGRREGTTESRKEYSVEYRLSIPVKLDESAGSEASDRFSPSRADCVADEYICLFWSTTIMPLPPVLFAEGNCAAMMFWASCDSAFVGPPKLEPATL